MPGYYNRSWRRSWYRRGTSSASKRGFSTFTCRIPLEDVVNFTIPASTSTVTNHWAHLVCTCPYASFKTNASKQLLTQGSLMDSYLYRTYTRIYDQVKINAVSVSIGVLEGVGLGGSLAALRIYTNWDRCLDWSEINKPGGYPTTPEDLATGSESQNNLIVNNSKQVFKRYIYARDMQERSTYHDCTYVNVPKRVTSDNAYTMNEAYWGDEAWAPCLDLTSNSSHQTTGYGVGKQIGFVPSLMMSIWSPSTFETDRVIPVSLKVTYSVTFRNPKFGLSAAGGAKFSERAMDAVEDVKAEMEDGKEIDDVPVLRKKKKVVIEEEKEDDDDELNPFEDESMEEQEPFAVPKPVTVKKAGKKSSG